MKCDECGKVIPNPNINQRFCSGTCRGRYHYKKNVPSNTKLNRGKSGDVSELEVCSHFIKEGWEVFRNVSQNGPADIVIWNPETDEVRIIDVKTNITETKWNHIKPYHSSVEILQYDNNKGMIVE